MECKPNPKIHWYWLHKFWYVDIKTHSYVKSYLRYLSCYKEKLETSWSTSWVMLLTPSQGKHRYFIHDPLAYFVWWPVDFSVYKRQSSVSSHRPQRPIVWWFITIILTNVTIFTAIVRCIEGKRVKYRAPFISFDSWMKISSSVREFLIFFSQISSIEIISWCEMRMVPKWSIRTNLNKASFREIEEYKTKQMTRYFEFFTGLNHQSLSAFD